MNRLEDGSQRWLMIAAFLTLYLVWGSTYLAIKFAIETMPPLLMAGIRFVIAGSALYAIVGTQFTSRPTVRQWVNCLIVGTLLFGGGNGLVCLSQRTVPSSLASLVIATTPLWIVLLETVVFRAARPGLQVVLGLALGLAGVAVLVDPFGASPTSVHPLGAIGLLTACFCWSLGSLVSRTMNLPASTFLTAGMQMIGGGTMLIAVSTALGEWSEVRWEHISAKSLWSFAYLIICGSMLALSAYTWLLRNCDASKVSTYAYVNPIIAVILGAWLGKERIGTRAIVAGGLIIASVVLIVSRRTSRPTNGTGRPPVLPSKDTPHDTGITPSHPHPDKVNQI